MLLFLSLAAQGKKINDLSVVHSNYFSLSLFLLFFPRHRILLQKQSARFPSLKGSLFLSVERAVIHFK